MKSDAGAEHVATLQTRKGLEALEPKCCGLCCTAGATLAGSRQTEGLSIYVFRGDLFWSARKAIPHNVYAAGSSLPKRKASPD